MSVLCVMCLSGHSSHRLKEEVGAPPTVRHKDRDVVRRSGTVSSVSLEEKPFPFPDLTSSRCRVVRAGSSLSPAALKGP